MSERVYADNYEEGYKLLAEKLELPIDKNDEAARLAFVKNFIKGLVEL